MNEQALAQPLVAEGFINYKRRRRAQYGTAFAILAIGSVLAFSVSASSLISVDAEGQIRTTDQRRSVLLKKVPTTVTSFALSLPLVAIAIRLKRLSEDSHDLREEQRIAHRQWQNVLYQPPSPQELRSIELPPSPPAELNLNILLNASLLLIYGGQGSAKTTFARGLGFIRQSMGHSIRVADPHGAAVRWQPWPVLGSGRNYSAVNTALKDFDEEVTQRYEQYSVGVDHFPRNTVICDELTQWADHVATAPAFIKSACSDIRKIMLYVVLISHGDTVDTIGGAKGLKTAFDGNAVKLHLESTLNPTSGEYMPTGFGTLYIPGQASQRVKVPDMRQYISRENTLPSMPSIHLLPQVEGEPVDLPDVCKDFLTWMAENRALAEAGYIRKSVIQQKFKPHRKGMDKDVFSRVLSKMASLGYIEVIDEPPARVKLLQLP